jgi:hypothetical protein
LELSLYLSILGLWHSRSRTRARAYRFFSLDTNKAPRISSHRHRMPVSGQGHHDTDPHTCLRDFLHCCTHPEGRLDVFPDPPTRDTETRCDQKLPSRYGATQLSIETQLCHGNHLAHASVDSTLIVGATASAHNFTLSQQLKLQAEATLHLRTNTS